MYEMDGNTDSPIICSICLDEIKFKQQIVGLTCNPKYLFYYIRIQLF